MKCAHATCTCREATVESGGKRYCSDKCASAPASSLCPCGHKDCKGGARTGFAT
ncbi:MAG TPA: hypothetical protein VGQ78_01385 [Vicinamibacteria bacterium]|jgi:hypothetical protein|nr:hypothetical protein [Vicinamibacteria bacterium]